MKKLNKVRGTLQKIDDQDARIIDEPKFDKNLNKLEQGNYEIIVRPLDSKLNRMKKAYFAMESAFANHMGIKKTELHVILQDWIGHKIDHKSGKEVYESVADLDDEYEVLTRIEELHFYTATEHSYTFPPYKPPDD